MLFGQYYVGDGALSGPDGIVVNVLIFIFEYVRFDPDSRNRT
jgi:hypothetical protein